MVFSGAGSDNPKRQEAVEKIKKKRRDPSGFKDVDLGLSFTQCRGVGRLRRSLQMKWHVKRHVVGEGS